MTETERYFLALTLSTVMLAIITGVLVTFAVMVMAS